MPQKHSFGIDGYVLVYSIDNRSSFEILQTMREKLFHMNGRNLPSILIANKHDNEQKRKVRTSEGKALADYWGIPFLEISALNDEMTQVDTIFDILMEEIREEEFPSRMNQYQLRKMSPITRQRYLKCYTISNIVVILLGVFFLIFGLYLVVMKPDLFKGNQSLLMYFLVLIGVLLIVGSTFAIIGCHYLRNELLITVIASGKRRQFAPKRAGDFALGN